ncbi:MAG: hypothetical protein J2P45_05405 [Candidatus Dormibacteraeota bacterium]|nr:hypothetical protein [Candidatus Dormibacteraeota bacterium]
MTGPRRRKREVIRSPLFASQARQIQPNAPRFERQLWSVEDAVSRAAEVFPLVPGTRLRVAKTDAYPWAPRLRILFTVDDEYHATLQSVELMEGPAPD